MNQFTFEKPEAGLTVKNGVISIITKSKPIIIREASLNVMESFYRDWQHGMALIANSSFIEGWTNNLAANSLLKSALGYFGLTEEQINSLTFNQLQLLLVADDNGGPGVIFGMHNTFPKPLSSPKELKTITKNYLMVFLSQLPLLIQYFQQEYTSSEGLVVKNLQKAGLLALSCTIWLLRFILTFLGRLKNKSN